MADPIQRAIASSVNSWLQAYPAATSLMQVLAWASTHPLISLVLFLLGIAIIFSLIKAISRLLEILGLSILKVPFQLIQGLIKVSFQGLVKLGNLAFKGQTVEQSSNLLPLQDTKPHLIEKDKQQRLAEISTRLEAIRQEQNQLLEEVTSLLNSNS
jgi:hypothetical protein